MQNYISGLKVPGYVKLPRQEDSFFIGKSYFYRIDFQKAARISYQRTIKSSTSSRQMYEKSFKTG